jgi:hypothetical protein
MARRPQCGLSAGRTNTRRAPSGRRRIGLDHNPRLIQDVITSKIYGPRGGVKSPCNYAASDLFRWQRNWER